MRNAGQSFLGGVDAMASHRTRILDERRGKARERAATPIDLVSRIQRIEQELSPAERRLLQKTR